MYGNFKSRYLTKVYGKDDAKVVALNHVSFSVNSRILVTSIGIILSVSLITAVTSMFSSGINSLIALEKREKGNFHIILSNISSSEIDRIRKNSNVEDVFISKDIGYSKIGSSNNENPYAYIIQYDRNSLENQIKLKE